MIKIDVALDLSYGDSGKGKIVHSLLTKEKYTHVMRFSGGQNAGHTIYHNNKKFITHMVPAGIFYGIQSVIGTGCVFNVNKLQEEIEYLEENGIKNIQNLLKISNDAHIIMDKHILEDSRDTVIGTTKTGNGPCICDRYSRKGLRAKDVLNENLFFKDMLINSYEEFYGQKERTILMEGSQGHFLDIFLGDYPYVTSSHCGIGSVLLNGFGVKHIRNVYGVAKVYETYVGAKQFQPDNKDKELFEKIVELGQEFGATTGRKRQINWLNLSKLVEAIEMNSINHMVILNKIDILEKLNVWKLYYRNNLLTFFCKNSFIDFIQKEIQKHNPELKVVFSDNPYDI